MLNNKDLVSLENKLEIVIQESIYSFMQDHNAKQRKQKEKERLKEIEEFKKLNPVLAKDFIKKKGFIDSVYPRFCEEYEQLIELRKKEKPSKVNGDFLIQGEDFVEANKAIKNITRFF